MIGWAWAGSDGSVFVHGARACGVSADQGQILQSAEEWLLLNQAATVIVGQVRIPEGGDILLALRSPYGQRLVGVVRYGRLAWQAFSAIELAATR